MFRHYRVIILRFQTLPCILGTWEISRICLRPNTNQYSITNNQDSLPTNVTGGSNSDGQPCGQHTDRDENRWMIDGWMDGVLM